MNLAVFDVLYTNKLKSYIIYQKFFYSDLTDSLNILSQIRIVKFKEIKYGRASYTKQVKLSSFELATSTSH